MSEFDMDEFRRDVWVRYTLPEWESLGWSGFEREGDVPNRARVLVRYRAEGATLDGRESREAGA